MFFFGGMIHGWDMNGIITGYQLWGSSCSFSRSMTGMWFRWLAVPSQTVLGSIKSICLSPIKGIARPRHNWIPSNPTALYLSEGKTIGTAFSHKPSCGSRLFHSLLQIRVGVEEVLAKYKCMIMFPLKLKMTIWRHTLFRHTDVDTKRNRPSEAVLSSK